MTKTKKNEISIILPARNEASSLESLLPKLKLLYPDAQIIVVDDKSEDSTEAVCQKYNVDRITNKRHLGNGGSIKAGTRKARGQRLV
ncbi:MAG: glycosyltransferase, partial [Thiohalomonadales bacterium]